MYSTRTRIALIVVSAFGALYFLLAGRLILGLACIASALLFAYGYRAYGTVWLAWRALENEDHDKAARLIAQVGQPASLTSPQRAYYEVIAGVLASDRADWGEADEHLRQALASGLRTDNDRAFVEFLLARVAVARGDASAAARFLHDASTRACKPDLVRMIDDFRVLIEDPPAEHGHPAGGVNL